MGGLEEGTKGTEGGKSWNSISNKAQLLKTVQFEKDCSIGECQALSSKCCELHSSKIQGRGRVLMGVSK